MNILSRWDLPLLLLLGFTISLQTCNAAHRPSLLPLVRGGARWASSPTGLETPGRSRQKQRYPIVEDLAKDDSDNQETKEVIDAFLTRDSRNTFIARVYAILSVQLLVTALTICVFGFNPSLGAWMRQAGSFVPLLSLVLSSIAWFLICGSVRARREAPIKWQLLTVFTLGESVAVGFITSFYKFSAVLSAMGATAVAATTVSAYTLLNKNPKYDLSQWGAGLSSAGMIFLMYGLVHLLEQYGVLPAGFLPYREAWFSLAGAVLFSFYLAYHTKLIVSGKYTKFQMNEKDYVFGAMSLYNDVINMFIYILRLIGEDQRK